MILVTGGTGLVGSHLLYALLKEGQEIRAIKRANSNLQLVKDVFSSCGNAALFNKIQWVTADLLDIPRLEDAFKGVTHVFHCAAKISFATAAYRELLKVNIEGTANIVNLCISNNIKKLCHVSTVAALGPSLNGKPIDEETHWNPEEDNNGYAISKFGAEMEVWRGSQEGLDVIIIQPSVILGEGHWESASGNIFTQIKKGIPKYPKGGTGFVDVKDVVHALSLLMKSDVKNESFVLSSTNSKYQDVILQIATQLGVKAPKKPASDWELLLLSFFQRISSLFTNKAPSLNKNSIYALQHISAYNGEKITEMIPFTYTPLAETINRVCRLL